MKSKISTHNLGYPRIGRNRELKKATEAYWGGKIGMADLERVARDLRSQNWNRQKSAGIDWIPCNDFSFYDQVLDMSQLVGNIPDRFPQGGHSLDTLFLVARGIGSPAGHEGAAGCGCHGPAAASEMTKWFDTNYHYLVPELHSGTEFHLGSSKVFDEYEEAAGQGIAAKPVLLGPLSYLMLGKSVGRQAVGFDRLQLMDRLLPVYEEILQRLSAMGAEWVQIDEPILAMELGDEHRKALRAAVDRMAAAAGRCRILLASYFGPLLANLPTFLDLPVAGLHYDAVRGFNEVEHLIGHFPQDKILSLGVVDGRNVWKNDFERSLVILRRALSAVGEDRLWVAPSCSLLHCPQTLDSEGEIDGELRGWLAFADEKLGEVHALRRLLAGEDAGGLLENNRLALASRRSSQWIHNDVVKRRVEAIRPEDFERKGIFAERRKFQQARLRLPLFPTTTIGSFPQTREVRSARAKWKRGEIPTGAYEAFLRQAISDCVKFQSSIGLDMLVHGEFERNDMVEYFGEQMEGFAFTAQGWVQSYGTRCVKPPIIFGDVRRPGPMTVRWSEYAASLTGKPVKGMLTGPVTILQWSFVRDDQPRHETMFQIALAIRDEVVDLEKAGLAAIQIDEPAFREGLPLQRSEWAAYLDRAAAAFRLCSSAVRNETQIHTHMCYSEFNDIIQAIADMDADVITIETSRSNMELLEAFVDFDYPNEIGPGVYDIHSPRVPEPEEMEELIRKAIEVIPPDRLWINPDCGLKTRGWEEVKPALARMVDVAKKLREASGGPVAAADHQPARA